MNQEQRRVFLQSLSPEEAEIFEQAMLKEDLPAWRDIARPEQIMPEGDWFTWGFAAKSTKIQAILSKSSFLFKFFCAAPKGNRL